MSRAVAVFVFLFLGLIFSGVSNEGEVFAAVYSTSCNGQTYSCSIDCTCAGGFTECRQPPNNSCVNGSGKAICNGTGDGVECSCGCGGGGGGGTCSPNCGGSHLGMKCEQDDGTCAQCFPNGLPAGATCSTGYGSGAAKCNYCLPVNQCIGLDQNSCGSLSGCRWDDCKVKPSPPPPPPPPPPRVPPLSCQIKGDRVSKVVPGESKKLEAVHSGGVPPFKFLWTVNSPSGSNGFLSSPNTASVVTWTAPESLTASQEWTVTLRIRDSRRTVDFCTKEMKFAPKPIVSSEAFFQTFKGDVSAKAELSNSTLPEGKAISGAANDSDSDAGLVLGASVLLPDNGSKFSENGNGSGIHLSPYSTKASLPTYAGLFKNFLANSGFVTVAKIPACPDGDFDSPPFHIWCYGSDLDSKILAAIRSPDDPDIKFHVFVPNPTGNLGSKTLTTAFSGGNAINKNMLVFVNGNGDNFLKIQSDLEIKQVDEKHAMMTIVNGGIKVAGEVKKLDGFFVFSGPFSDGASDLKIEATGSLIGLAENSFDSPYGLLRTFKGADSLQPAEKWVYDGKYLSLFQNVLGRPKFFWKQLPGK